MTNQQRVNFRLQEAGGGCIWPSEGDGKKQPSEDQDCVYEGFCLNHVSPLCKAFVVYSTYTDNEDAMETKVPN